MDGIFVNGKRPKSKKAIKEAFAADPASVELECTSIFNTEDYSGPLTEVPPGTYHYVGPCPSTDRRFYGSIVITKRNNERKVTIK